MNLLQIQCFLKLYEELNFTRAAEKLYIAQPHLSRQIAALEEELNARLFLRDSHSVRATNAAHLMLDDFRQALTAMESIQRKAAIATDHIRHTLAMSVDHLFMCTPLIEAVGVFRENHLDIDMIFKKGEYADCMSALDRGTADAVMTFRFFCRNLPDEEVITLRRLRLVLAVRSSSLWCRQIQPKQLADFSSAIFCMPTCHDTMKSPYNPVTRFQADSYNVRRVEALQEVLLQVERGLSVGLLPEIDRLAYNQRILKYPIAENEDGGDVVIIYKKHRMESSHALRELVDFLHDYGIEECENRGERRSDPARSRKNAGA